MNSFQTNITGVKPQTIAIDTKLKECYYQSPKIAVKEPVETLKNRNVFWNYMMNVSMQNTIAQMAKRQ